MGYGQSSFIITMIVSWSSKFPGAPFFSPSRQVFLLHENPGRRFFFSALGEEHLPPFLPQFLGVQKANGETWPKTSGAWWHRDFFIFVPAPYCSMGRQTFIFGGGLSSHTYYWRDKIRLQNVVRKIKFQGTDCHPLWNYICQMLLHNLDMFCGDLGLV